MASMEVSAMLIPAPGGHSGFDVVSPPADRGTGRGGANAPAWGATAAQQAATFAGHGQGLPGHSPSCRHHAPHAGLDSPPAPSPSRRRHGLRSPAAVLVPIDNDDSTLRGLEALPND